MSGALDLAKELGLSNEDLANRVIDRCAERVLESAGYDEDGEPEAVRSSFARKLQAAVIKRIDAGIDAIAQKHVLPNVTQYLETLTLQETNQWGEKRGASLTFIEYLVQRAEHYLNEQVDFSGKSKRESSYGSGWSGTQTRICALVHEHLHYAIKNAMEKAVKDANAAIVGGIEKTVKIKLAEIGEALKVEVKSR